MNLEKISRDEKIIYYYVENLMSVRQTAKVVGCSAKLVRRILNEKGVIRGRELALKLRSTDEYISKIATSKLGTKNASAKLDENKVREIRVEYEKMQRNESKFKTKTELAKHYGVKRPTVNDILFGRTWTHVK